MLYCDPFLAFKDFNIRHHYITKHSGYEKFKKEQFQSKLKFILSMIHEELINRHLYFVMHLNKVKAVCLHLKETFMNRSFHLLPKRSL